jgi:hypothetical protein
MTKELLTIEFRYTDVPKGEHDSEHKSKTITIGVFDTLEEAIVEGNKAMEVFEDYFKLNPHYNTKERFSKNGGCFGYPKRLITALGYLHTPFEFYTKIEELKYDDVDKTIIEVLKSVDRYKEYKRKNEDG